MAKGDNKKGPSVNTRKGSKRGEEHCNQVDAGSDVSNTQGQASGSDQGNMGVSQGNSITI